MERTTIESHVYISGRELKNMKFLGLGLALVGIVAMIDALQSTSASGYAFWGWLATLAGLIMVWGEAHEAILEEKSTTADRFIILVFGLAIVLGMPLSLIMLI